MDNHQLIDNEEALRLFFTEEVYTIDDNQLETDLAKPEASNLDFIKDEDSKTGNNHNNIPQKSISFEYKGGNKRKILIIVNDTDYKVVSPTGKIIFSNILNAIKLTKEDYAFVNLYEYPNTSIEQLQSFFACKILLSFGVSAKELGIITSTPNNQIGEHNQIQFIITEALHPLESNNTAKKELWKSLKSLFSI